MTNIGRRCKGDIQNYWLGLIWSIHMHEIKIPVSSNENWIVVSLTSLVFPYGHLHLLLTFFRDEILYQAVFIFSPGLTDWLPWHHFCFCPETKIFQEPYIFCVCMSFLSVLNPDQKNCPGKDKWISFSTKAYVILWSRRDTLRTHVRSNGKDQSWEKKKAPSICKI